MNNLCSYCRNSGHNIKSCNDNYMLLFHQFILHEKIENYSNQNIFIEILGMQPLHKLWGFAVKYCNILARNKNKNECILAIQNKYVEYTITMLENELNELNTRINRRPLPLFFDIDTNNQEQEQDLDQDQDEDFELLSVSTYHSSIDDDELEITWSIDRTGDYINNNKIKTIQDFPITFLTIELESEKECNICYENQNIKNYIKLQCNHEFCHDCIQNQLNNNKTTCAFCRDPFQHLFCIK